MLSVILAGSFLLGVSTNLIIRKRNGKTITVELIFITALSLVLTYAIYGLGS